MLIRIILADDHPVIRKGIRDYLAATLDITLVAEAINGSEKTVEKYLDHLYRKFDIDSRVQLAVLLVRDTESRV